jgi:hypothetical protein
LPARCEHQEISGPNWRGVQFAHLESALNFSAGANDGLLGTALE